MMIPSAIFVAVAGLTGACFWSAFDLHWANLSSGYMRLTIASDVAKGGLPPVLLGTALALVLRRLVRDRRPASEPLARVTTYGAAAAAGLAIGTVVTAISRIVTGTLFTF